MSDCGCEFEAKNKAQRQVLKILFAANAAMFIIGITAGTLARSTALVADSLDMLADAAVFGISLYVIGKSQAKKIRAAFLSGIFQTTLASLVLVDVFKRAIFGSEPESNLMIGIALLSLMINSYCMFLMSKHRHEEVHMRSSWIFLSNDVIANFGVIVAGLLVSLFNSRFPDLVIGFIIAIVVIRGGTNIIREAQREKVKQ
ncbi:MAG: cation transporter [Leptolyngbya sp. UWPOB_LEPTO1]|uniref:cation transporter n=1 Tax=Leptolyngbya sp. UWPOB_LEPTO1 TaxID=2815653 RepID=UPI001AD114AE|nr:cation transporter [Leptolyngbya sp. UWPOB_LEPTO1]MBN8560161.1 cation transporter [Leptolyngbya sp. UWPOB_LEPTO1]